LKGNLQNPTKPVKTRMTAIHTSDMNTPEDCSIKSCMPYLLWGLNGAPETLFLSLFDAFEILLVCVT
jgi:hypothetical protein